MMVYWISQIVPVLTGRARLLWADKPGADGRVMDYPGKQGV